MKIVVLDGYAANPGDISWEPLKKLGELVVYDRTPYDDKALLINRVKDANVILTNKTPIKKETIDACSQLQLISVLATGYNIVDYEYCKEKNIPVCNIPGYSTEVTAQFAVGLLLEICSHIGEHSASVHRGEWERCRDFVYWNFPLIELSHKTAGIIGFGNIGRATGKILSAMNMRVLATGSRPTPEGEAIAEYVDLDTLLRESDVILLHCPLFPETRGLINKDTIAKMKDGVILINNSRGPVIVEQDVADALNSGKIYAAGVDVVSAEPIKADNPLLKAKNCIITPHISWAAGEARQRIMEVTEENIRGFLDKKPVHVVNGV